jgi:hypothetical protein
MVQWRSFAIKYIESSRVIELWNLLISRKIISFSKRTLIHGVMQQNYDFI